jgi:hypothetical protein
VGSEDDMSVSDEATNDPIKIKPNLQQQHIDLPEEYEEGDEENTALLLTTIAKQQENESSQSSGKTKQSKQAKKFLKKMDINLKALKMQNTEIISQVTTNNAEECGTENLIQMSNNQHGLMRSQKGLAMLNLTGRDVIVIMVVCVFLVPLVVTAYTFWPFV